MLRRCAARTSTRRCASAVGEWPSTNGAVAATATPLDRRDEGGRSDCRLGRFLPFDPDWGVEVGYHFHPAAWGRGYATELAAACMSIADNVLQLPEVNAFARPENVASRRVLEKVGFELVRLVPEMERFLYRRRRHDMQSTG
jgi:RimJ/RimL family protein N-acetyltransferase